MTSLSLFTRTAALLLTLAASPLVLRTQGQHPPVGTYQVYMFDPYGNAEYAFDFELLSASAPGKPGRYELQMGRTSPGDRAEWRGEYEFDPAGMRLRWLSGPLERSSRYRQDAKNPQGGKVVVKNGRWTVFLNNTTRGTSAPR